MSGEVCNASLIMNFSLVEASDGQEACDSGAGREVTTSQLVVGLYTGLAFCENLQGVSGLSYEGSKELDCCPYHKGFQLTRKQCHLMFL